MFTGKAEEAMKFYVSLFPGSEILSVVKCGAGDPAGDEGKIKNAKFRIADQHIVVYDSKPVHDFTFTPAFSLFVNAESEEEIKKVAKALAEGGKELMPLGNYGFSKQFAWVQDKFGVSWQINLE